MNERIWDKFLTERDKAVFAASGYGAHAGFGKRPALLVIDVNWAFCGERPEPILESIKRWRNSCGEESWVALEYIKSLIEAARAKGLPVIYTTGERRSDNWDAGSWRWKSTRADETGGAVHDDVDGNQIWALRDDLVPVVTDTILEISRRLLRKRSHEDRFWRPVSPLSRLPPCRAPPRRKTDP